MEHEHCLNCHLSVKGNFCEHCGQKTSTHRYSIKHFLEHDVVHGIWHVDKGIFYTIKELFTRPGHSIREYIEGKRARHFNFISLILIGLAVSFFLDPYIKVQIKDLVVSSKESQNMVSQFDDFSTKYPRLVMAIFIPFNAIFSFLWFRKAKYNYSEHLVLNSYKSVAETVVGLVFKTITVFYANIPVLSFMYNTVIMGFSIVYNFWFLRQFFSHSGYSKKGLLWRSFLVPITFILFTGIITAIFMFISMRSAAK